MLFPNLDPIPLPAPVWLMKTLGLLTLALHFAAVFLMLGSLVMAVYFNWRGSLKRDETLLSASLVMTKRLPVIMTYVINLGVPPLLFTQVLYGRAIYASSVLIGAIWFSVIPMLMLGYWLLYRMGSRIQEGRFAYVHGLLALLLMTVIAQIFTMNMTLMIRPEVWQAMYARDALGTTMPPSDPQVGPRIMFMFSAAMSLTGIWMMLIAHSKSMIEPVSNLLRRVGGLTAFLFAIPQLWAMSRVYGALTQSVRDALNASTIHTVFGYAAGATIVITAVVGLIQLARASKPGLLLPILGSVTGFLSAASAVVYRDGIRDFTLFQKGFDVWKQPVVPNWGVLAMFLVLFVVALACVGWLLSVMKRATPIEERVSL